MRFRFPDRADIVFLLLFLSIPNAFLAGEFEVPD